MKLMGKNYRIKQVKKLESKSGKDLMGHINYDEQIIKICSDYPRKSKEDTLVHEIVHGVLHHSGISECIDSYQLEEGVVRAISNELDNLGVGKFLGDKYLK